jgi:hypothetical protein
MKKILKLQFSLWEKLQLQNLSYIVCFSFLFWTPYKQGDNQIKKFVHMGWTNQKVQPKTKETNYTHLKVSSSQPTYLFN